MLRRWRRREKCYPVHNKFYRTHNIKTCLLVVCQECIINIRCFLHIPYIFYPVHVWAKKITNPLPWGMSILLCINE